MRSCGSSGTLGGLPDTRAEGELTHSCLHAPVPGLDQGRRHAIPPIVTHGRARMLRAPLVSRPSGRGARHQDEGGPPTGGGGAGIAPCLTGPGGSRHATAPSHANPSRP